MCLCRVELNSYFHKCFLAGFVVQRHFSIQFTADYSHKLALARRLNWLVVLLLNRDLEIRQRRRQQEPHKSNRFNNQNNNFCTCITLFCTFLCHHCTTTTWKCLISRCTEEVHSDDEVSSLFLSFYMLLRNSTLGGIAYISQSKSNRNEDWKNANSLFQRHFLCHHRGRILRSLMSDNYPRKILASDH